MAGGPGRDLGAAAGGGVGGGGGGVWGWGFVSAAPICKDHDTILRSEMMLRELGTRSKDLRLCYST